MQADKGQVRSSLPDSCRKSLDLLLPAVQEGDQGIVCIYGMVWYGSCRQLFMLSKAPQELCDSQARWKVEEAEAAMWRMEERLRRQSSLPVALLMQCLVFSKSSACTT